MRHFLFWIIFSVGLSQSLFAQSIELAPIQVVGTISGSGYVDDDSYLRPEHLVLRVSGVDSQSRVGEGFLQDVSIRGGLFEDTGVFLNGISLGNPQTGHYHLSLPVVSSDIETTGVRLNSQAINFQLREPKGNEGYIRSSVGNAGFVEQVVSFTQKSGSDYHRFSAEGLRTDGLRDETDGYRMAGSYLFRRRTAEHDGTVYAAVSEKKFGANGAYAAPWYMKEQEYLKQELLMGDWTFHHDLDVTIKPYFHRTQNTFLLDRDNPTFYRNDHASYVSGNVFELTDPVSGRFVSVELERQDIRSTNLGIHHRFFYAGEVGLKFQHDGLWQYGGGIKAAYFDQFPMEILPRFDIGYQLSSHWNAHVKMERILRQPSFTELYYQAPSDQGNPNLGLQRSDNLEIGLTYDINDFWFNFDVFIRRQKDTIDWVRNIGDPQYQAVNAGQVDVKGFDMTIGGKVDLVIFNQVSVTYTYMDLEKTHVYDISKYVFEYLRHRAVMSLDSQIGKWSCSVKGVFEEHVTLGSRWLFGAQAAYQINTDLKFFTTAENLFNKSYEEFRHIKGDPLFVKAGLEMRF